ncbi:MAG: hypothetical protein JW924_07950 [Fusobacteriaceae bacterium]|nr:hypothetical protein [Fusobacteriaceae bacterium]
MGTKINPAKISNQDMMNAQAYSGMVSKIEKLGKSKRKNKIFFDKVVKKYFKKIIEQFIKQLNEYPSNPQSQKVIEFYTYLDSELSKAANHPVMLSFEELEFLKATLSETVKGMDKMEFKWYSFLRKIMNKSMAKQIKEILEILKK